MCAHVCVCVVVCVCKFHNIHEPQTESIPYHNLYLCTGLCHSSFANDCMVSRLLCNLFSMPIQKIKVLTICTVPKNPREMIIIVGGEPDVHGAARHAKRKGGVYARP